MTTKRMNAPWNSATAVAAIRYCIIRAMKRRAIVLFFLLAAACASVPPAQGPVHVVIVGTTDVHGWLAGHQRDNPQYGGLPVLASYVNALRAANDNHVLVVDSGDLYQGTPESNLFEGAPNTLRY